MSEPKARKGEFKTRGVPRDEGVKLLRTFEGHTGQIWSVAFDPHGGMLATGSRDETVRLWDARTGELLRTFEGHQGDVGGVAFDSTGGIVVSGGDDKKLRLWNTRTGDLIRTLKGHTEKFGPWRLIRRGE